MESMVLGTFYPLDIKGDMPGCVITNRKINAETHTSEISFSSNHIFKGWKKKEAIANKNDYRTGGFTKLEQGMDWDQAQTVNKLGSVLRPVPAHPPDCPAPPRAELSSRLPQRTSRAQAPCTVPSPPTPATHHTWPQTMWKTPAILRPLLFPPSLYHPKGRVLDASRSSKKVERTPGGDEGKSAGFWGGLLLRS